MTDETTETTEQGPEYSVTLPFYTVSKEFHFSASHRLMGLPADHPCTRLHGHNYIVRVMVGSRHTDEVGFVVDYHDLAFVGAFLDSEWDHRHLNDQEVFKRHNPTAEVMASVLVSLVAERLVGKVDMIEVGVSETPKTWATCQVVIGRDPMPNVGDQPEQEDK